MNEKAVRKDNGAVIVEVSQEFYRPAEVDVLLGDPSKANTILGWEAKTDCSQLAQIMYEADFNQLKMQ